MLYTFLDNLRSKPKASRDKYAMLGAICCTLVIGGFWSLSIPTRLSSMASTASTTSVASAPVSGFFTQLKSQFKSASKVVALPTMPDTLPDSAAASAAAALQLELTPENRQLNQSPTSTIRFGQTTIAPATKAAVATDTASTTGPEEGSSSGL